ncbi:conserved hypothetical protein [Ricinus communis]|uniref:Uncharacterized protein n=1 Tax=Ricinus communis TaxID=3988 RepID=B9SX61_RICCO|nr:conserved hypothetical protein [Ricinus communis]
MEQSSLASCNERKQSSPDNVLHDSINFHWLATNQVRLMVIFPLVCVRLSDPRNMLYVQAGAHISELPRLCSCILDGILLVRLVGYNSELLAVFSMITTS